MLTVPKTFSCAIRFITRCTINALALSEALLCQALRINPVANGDKMLYLIDLAIGGSYCIFCNNSLPLQLTISKNIT